MTHDLRRRLPLLLALGALLLAPPVYAEDAKTLLKKADKLFAAGDYKGAYEAYEAGHKLQPQAVFLRSMGYSLLKLYQHEKARDKLREYLKAAPKAADKAKITELLGTLDVIVETVLTVESNPPGAALFIDTEAAGQVGTTPFKGSIPPGAHTVILKLEPYKTTVKSFTVEARKKAELSIGLEVPFKVSSTPAGASVHLDSESAPSLGPTPYDGGIPFGKRTVFLKLAGYKTFKQELEVAKGAVEIKAELALGIKVVSTPPGASVELDGKGLPGVTPLEETATPGKHQVTVKLEGYKPYSAEIEVAPGKENTVNALLGGGMLTMRTDVDGAKVAVSGRELGASPLEKGAVPLGKQTVSVTHPDRRPWSREIDFAEGQAVRAKVRLGRSMTPVWIGVGVAAAGAVMAIVGTVLTAKQATKDDEATGQFFNTKNERLTPPAGSTSFTGACKPGKGGESWGAGFRTIGDYTFRPDDPSITCEVPAASFVGGIGYGVFGAGAAFALGYYLFGARASAEIETVPATTAARPSAPKIVFQGNGFRF